MLTTVTRPCFVSGCPTLTRATHCPPHAIEHERRRGSRQTRGYGRDHDRARRALASTLPAPCGYCGQLVGSRWVAAHVVDGQPECGWMVAHPTCNERAKGEGGALGMGTPSGPALPGVKLRTGS